MDRKEVVPYIETFSNAIIAITLFLLPLFFLPVMTEAFLIPKQILVIAASSILLLAWSLKIIVERKIVLNLNPLNVPIILFAGIAFLSSILSRVRYDSLIALVPFLAAVLVFFMLINNVREKKSFSFILSAYLLGAAVSVIVTVAYSFGLYFLPISQIQNNSFNVFGSSIQQLIYLIPAFLFCLFYIGRRLNFPNFRLSTGVKSDVGFFIQSVTGLLIFIGIVVIIYRILFDPAKPILLPYIYGFQTAFASISQDAQRFILSLLFGSGYGTFLVDFTRFKLPSFNLEQSLWNLSFSYSSSYFLELIATTGVLGGLAFIFLIIGMIRSASVKNPLFIALFGVFVLALILPFAYSSIFALFALAGIYIAYLNINQDRRVYDVSFSLIASKSGGFSFATTPEDEHLRGKHESPIFPVIVAILIAAIVAFIGFYSYNYVASDKAFADSLRAAASQNGQLTYNLQARAINQFPYRSDYHRVFSQVNLALANSISQSVPQGASPGAQVQQNIVTLLQQSINSARNAVTLSPLTSVNWQNLSQIYRSLIGVGQNADQFAIASQNQAIALDPYNPLLRISLGGIYYQLQQYDQAQNQFQIAINLKQDFANAYYNLGHALESKGDLPNALAAYRVVEQLSAGNQENLDRIKGEIAAIEARIGEQAQATGAQVTPGSTQTPLALPSPSANLPQRNPPIEISPPPSATEGGQTKEKK